MCVFGKDTPHHVDGGRITSNSQFSPAALTWIPGIEVRLPGLQGKPLTP